MVTLLHSFTANVPQLNFVVTWEFLGPWGRLPTATPRPLDLRLPVAVGLLSGRHPDRRAPRSP